MLKAATGDVREVLELRQRLAKTSVKKYMAMKAAMGADHRARGLFQFYGANRTGRFAGRFIQLQNLPKNNITFLTEVRTLVNDGSFDLLDMLYDSTADVLSQLIRTAFVPCTGSCFIVADYSAIEARVLAWLAGERWGLDVFRKNGDIYCETASRMFHCKVAGYESEENYVYLKANGQAAYIKPNNYERAKTRAWKNDIGHFENMTYLSDEDAYLCADGRKLTVTGTKTVKSKTGYASVKTCYKAEDCSGCRRKAECMRGRSKLPLEERTKCLEVAKTFHEERAASKARLTSEEGIQLRVNRSIQAEGVFANIKADMGFRRFLSRGNANVLVETMLLAMAHNFGKLHQKIQRRCGRQHLFSVEVAA